MEITLSELRLNNCISLNYKDGTHIDKKVGYNEWVNIYMGTYKNNNIKVSGIELSSDILIKAGFETKHWGNITTIEKNITSDVYFTLNNTAPEVVLYANGQEVIRVTYLHQLQNLYFALTGTELNITL